jgi:hypothetical protein
VRQQLERCVSESSDQEPGSYVLYKIRKEAILFISDTQLSNQYLDNWEQHQKSEAL